MDPQRPNEQRCRDIVAAYRRERLPADTRATAWARLQAAIDDDATAASDERREHRRGLVWAALLVAAALLIWLVGARGRLPGRADEGDDRSQAAHEAARTTEVLAPSVGSGSVPAVDARPESAEKPAPEVGSAAPARPSRAPTTRSIHVPKDMPSLDAELALLRAAREALARHDAAAALASLEQHARRFPAGHLIEERMLLRVQAQCELGQRAAARASAAEFVRDLPNSPHARAVAGLCED